MAYRGAVAPLRFKATGSNLSKGAATSARSPATLHGVDAMRPRHATNVRTGLSKACRGLRKRLPSRAPLRGSRAAGLLAFACLLTGLLAARPAGALVFVDSAAQAAGLGAGQSFLNAEAWLTISTRNGGSEGCSGSLLAGGEYVLTAAHCLAGGSVSAISVNFANAGLTVSASTYIIDPQWTGSVYNGGDLALVALDTALTAIQGYQVDTASSAVGDVVTLVGYGDTGVGSTGYVPYSSGTLYYGQNVYAGIFADVPTAYEIDFAADGGAVGSQEVMIAPGDSGGASLIEVNGNWTIVGVHDFIACDTVNCTPNSSFGQFGGDTSVYANAAWLDQYLAPEPSALSMIGSGVAGLAALRRRRLRPWRYPRLPSS